MGAKAEIRASQLRVLLVEDDEDDYLITEDLLSEIEGLKFDLEWAPDYDSALEAIANRDHDVYLFDYRLGSRSGIELLQECADRDSRTPAILLTGQSDRETDLEAMGAGASDYLVKGDFDAGLLERSIRYAIERKRHEGELYEAAARFRGAFEDAPIGMALVGLDGSWLRVNRSLCEIVGYTREELFRLTFQDITHPEDLDTDLEYLRQMLAGEIQTYQMEKRYFHKNRSIVWIMLSVSLVHDASGDPLYFVSQIQDFTERRRAEEELKENEERFRTLTDAALEGLVITEEGRIVEVNRAFTEIFGYEAKEVVGKTPDVTTAPESRETIRENILLGYDEPYEAVGLRKDGRRINLEIRGKNSVYHGRKVRITAIHDVTERKELERRLEHQATHDFLTGLPNRALFMENLEHAIARSGRRNDSLAVLFLDLDGFKLVNDSLGHEAGDNLLAAVAGRLKSCLRAGDVVARLGGDEFALLLEDITNVPQAAGVAERIIRELRKPFDLGGREASISTSVGICMNSLGYGSNDLLRNADMVMYLAKSKGKASYEVFEPDTFGTVSNQQR